MKRSWKLVNWKIELPNDKKIKEAGLLKLSCDKVNNYLEWYTTLNFKKTIEFTVLWYKKFYSLDAKDSISDLTLNQINEYCEVAKTKKLKWTL